MIEEKSIPEDFFQKIMSKSKLELPFPDFEDNVMIQIERENLHQLTFSKEIRLSWIFFIAGSVFGIIISLILPQLHDSIFGIHPETLTILFQIVFTLLLFTQMDILIKLIKKKYSNI